MKTKPRCFVKTVTTAGTQERLTTSELSVPAVLIQARLGNSGRIYIGDSDVSSSKTGIELKYGESISLCAAELGFEGALISLKDIWVDASKSADAVNVMYLEHI